MEPLVQPIVVGVTGVGENTDALRFALSEARASGVGVTLAHAVSPVLPPPPPSILIVDADWAAVGADIVGDVHRELEALFDGDPVPVETTVRHGHPGAVLAELSRSASMVVLQHRDLSRLHRIVSGSTVASVAAHAHCPVVSVPAGRRDGSGSRVVTAGVHGDGGPRQVLESAFAAASSRGAGLRVVHAWRLAQAYDDLLADEVRWTAADTALMTAAVDELRAKYPDVVADIDVRHDWPVDVLVEATHHSDLVVVGRHSGLPGLPHRLGSLARAVIAHTSCPVMVVPV